MTFQRLAVVSFFVLALAGCRDHGSLAGCRGEAFLLADKEKQKTVIEMLESASIDHSVGEDGFVNYLLKDYASVQSIVRTVEYGPELRNDIFESRRMLSTKQKEKYVEGFIENNVRFRIIPELGEYGAIEWSQLDSLGAYRVIQELEIAQCNETLE
ncbi:hypothetical protein [Spongiibacter sp.]|uniref:hypothetical protein n=1 Tax=Spongiibacter sp. TaxID=2024860 RepID=UPI0035625B4D